MPKIRDFITKKIFNLIVILALIGSAVLTAFRYRISVVRLIMAVKDLGISVAYYFCAFFDVQIKVTVTDLPDASILQPDTTVMLGSVAKMIAGSAVRMPVSLPERQGVPSLRQSSTETCMTLQSLLRGISAAFCLVQVA